MRRLHPLRHVQRRQPQRLVHRRHRRRVDGVALVEVAVPPHVLVVVEEAVGNVLVLLRAEAHLHEVPRVQVGQDPAGHVVRQRGEVPGPEEEPLDVQVPRLHGDLLGGLVPLEGQVGVGTVGEKELCEGYIVEPGAQLYWRESSPEIINNNK